MGEGELLLDDIGNGQTDADVPFADQGVGWELFGIENLPANYAVTDVWRTAVTVKMRRLDAADADIVKEGGLFDELQLRRSQLKCRSNSDRFGGDQPAMFDHDGKAGPILDEIFFQERWCIHLFTSGQFAAIMIRTACACQIHLQTDLQWADQPLPGNVK